MFRVVATDLDGTLFGSDRKVDPFTARTLREIEALGIHVVLATGRHYIDASYFRDALGLRAHLITSNGARVHDPDGAPIFAQDIEPAVGRALLSDELVGSTLLGVFVDEGWLANRPCPELDVYYQCSGFAARVMDLASHDGVGLAKVTYMGEEGELARLQAQILERFDDKVSMTFALGNCLEVMAPSVSKGPALTEILRRLEVPASACVAFGDGQNDIEMLLAAGAPFVMSRSSPRLLAALPGASSAGSNDEAGVARTLRGLLGLPVS